jgi:hypothetical protein
MTAKISFHASQQQGKFRAILFQPERGVTGNGYHTLKNGAIKYSATGKYICEKT